MRKLNKINLKQDYLVKGLSSRELAPIYGYSNRTILNKLEKFGIPRRTYKENKMPTRKGGHLSVKHRENISKSLKGNPKLVKIGEANPRWKRHKVKCFVCGKKIVRQDIYFKRFERFYCNPKCRSKYQKTLVGKTSPHWKGGDITVKCVQCGNNLERRKSVVEKSKTGRFFCNQRCAGIWKADNLTGSIVYNWRGGYDGYYGPNWNKQRRRVLERDNRTCQICKKTQKQLGKNPDVHHIIPFKKFTIKRYKEANKLSNLICFGNSCHSKVENGTIKLRGKNYNEVCKEIENLTLMINKNYNKN